MRRHNVSNLAAPIPGSLPIQGEFPSGVFGSATLNPHPYVRKPHLQKGLTNSASTKQPYPNTITKRASRNAHWPRSVVPALRYPVLCSCKECGTTIKWYLSKNSLFRLLHHTTEVPNNKCPAWLQLAARAAHGCVEVPSFWWWGAV